MSSDLAEVEYRLVLLTLSIKQIVESLSIYILIRKRAA